MIIFYIFTLSVQISVTFKTSNLQQMHVSVHNGFKLFQIRHDGHSCPIIFLSFLLYASVDCVIVGHDDVMTQKRFPY